MWCNWSWEPSDSGETLPCDEREMGVMSHKLATGETLEWVEGGVTSPLTVTQPHPPATGPPHHPPQPFPFRLNSITLLVIPYCKRFFVLSCVLLPTLFNESIYLLSNWFLQLIWFTFDCSCDPHTVSILSGRSCKLLLSYSPAYIKTGGWARPQVETGLIVPQFYLYL